MPFRIEFFLFESDGVAVVGFENIPSKNESAYNAYPYTLYLLGLFHEALRTN